MSSNQLCFSFFCWTVAAGLAVQQSPCQAAPKTAPKAKPAAHSNAKPAANARPAAVTPKSAPTNPALTAAYNSYINALKSKIEKTWNYPDGKNHVALSILVAQDGSVSDLKLSSTPNSPTAEQAANDAFNQAQPLPALPASSPPCRLTITFDSNADPHGDTKGHFFIKLDALPAKPEPKTVPDTSAPPDVDMTKTTK